MLNAVDDGGRMMIVRLEPLAQLALARTMTRTALSPFCAMPKGLSKSASWAVKSCHEHFAKHWPISYFSLLFTFFLIIVSRHGKRKLLLHIIVLFLSSWSRSHARARPMMILRRRW